MATSQRSAEMVSNTELYDRWAYSYDTDGNILQAVDDQEIPSLLADLFLRLGTGNVKTQQSKVTVTELGCGTGRNTLKLLQPPFCGHISRVCGLDLSSKMLQIARQRCAGLNNKPQVSLHIYNAMEDFLPPDEAYNANFVISTLVLEHITIDIFFTTVAKMLKKDGYLIITNMHADMGQRTQAGFLDEITSEKVTGNSYVYEINAVLEEAKRMGFQLVGNVKERMVAEADVDIIGARGRKWIGCKVWFGCIFANRGTS